MNHADHTAFDWGDGKYNCYRTNIGKIMHICVSWEYKHYAVKINNLLLTKKFDDLDSAKTAGLDKAEELLIKAMYQLDGGDK